MAIKMRYLYYAAGKKKFVAMGEYVKKKFDLQINSVDVIPPAYSCDKERIVILGLAVKNELPDQLRLFCRELTKARAQNVALIVEGNEKGAQAAIDTLKAAGTNVITDVLYVKSGLPFFGGSLKDDEKEALDKWLDKVIESIV